MSFFSLRRVLPVAILLAGLVTFFALGFNRYLSLEMLGRNEAEISSWVAANHALAAFAFVAVYATVVAFSLPASAVMAAASGFLFGVWPGVALSVVAQMLGSIALFLAARSAFRDLFHARAGAALARLEAGFQRDGFSYLVFLRLVPVFPSWLVTIVAALLGMKPSLFAPGTLIGIIPGCFVFAGIGADFGHLFRSGQTPDLGAIFQVRTLMPLLGLGVLALLPVLYRHWRRRS
jgi:uncharacterized membrane protein YdjX (TVP38/TMEM64 family)